MATMLYTYHEGVSLRKLGHRPAFHRQSNHCLSLPQYGEWQQIGPRRDKGSIHFTTRLSSIPVGPLFCPTASSAFVEARCRSNGEKQGHVPRRIQGW